MTCLSDENSAKKSEQRVLGTLTISHVAQHLFSGASILYESIRQDLGLSYTQIGMMVGIANILGGFLQMVYSVAGRWVSRRLLLSGSNFFMGIGCAMTGLASRFEAVITGNAVAGVGQAGTHPVSSSIIGSRFEKKGVGSALSVFYGLGYIGNIISPILLSGIAILAGWRSAYYLLAFCFVLTGFIALWGLRGEPAADKISAAQSGKRLWDDIKSALKVKGAVPILIAQAFISGGTGMGVMTTWVPMFMRDSTKGLGLDVGFAGIVSSIATVGGVLGTIYLGRIADRKGYLKIAMFSLVTTTAFVFLLTFYSDFNLLLIPHLFILSMTTFSMSSMLQAYLARSASPAERDILLGLFFTFGFGISSLWATLLGAMIDAYSFSFVWYTMVGAGIAALICLYFAARGQPPIPAE
ncbi:MAG: MFS transporter [Candidatus Bathyarchaeota archaeon]|nr:MFS transporter [Candidatus Bathyarchaeota archaeon]